MIYFSYLAPPLIVVFFVCLAISYVPGVLGGGNINQKHDFKNIDGIRGIAAILVIIHHSFLIFQHHINGKWYPWQGLNKEIEYNETLRIIIANLGGAGVCLFFMITGFLFFNKALSDNGTINVKSFYIKRFKRIAPMYYVSILVMVMMSFLYGINAVDSVSYAVKNWIGWLSFGLIPYESMTSAFKNGRINAGIIWTLAVEWQFYFIYPLICAFCGTKKTAAYFVLFSVIMVVLFNYTGVYDDKKSAIYLCFLIGMITALLRGVINSPIKNNIIFITLSLLCVILLSASVSINRTVYTPFVISIMGLFFVISVSGCSVFGLLNSRAMRAAGVISYSIYLMHGLIMNALLSITGVGIGHNNFIILSIFIIIAVSALTYLFVERRFMTNSVKKPI